MIERLWKGAFVVITFLLLDHMVTYPNEMLTGRLIGKLADEFDRAMEEGDERRAHRIAELVAEKLAKAKTR